MTLVIVPITPREACAFIDVIPIGATVVHGMAGVPR
jgi:hypothetical protein